MVILGAILVGGVPVSAQQMVVVSKAGNAALVCNPPTYQSENLPHATLWSLQPLRRCCSLQGDSRHWGNRYDVAFSPNGRLLAFTCGDGSIEIFDARTGKLRSLLHHVPGYPFSYVFGSIAFSPDGRTLARGAAKRLFLWDWRRKKLLSTSRIRYRAEEEKKLQGPPLDFTSGFLQFSPDGRTLAFQGWDFMPVFLFDVAHRRVSRALPINIEEGYALALRFSPDGRRLLVTSIYEASDSYFDQIHLFDTRSGHLRWRWDNSDVNKSLSYRFAAFSSNGRRIAVGTGERLEVRDARNERLKFARESKPRNPDFDPTFAPPLVVQKWLLPELAVR